MFVLALLEDTVRIKPHQFGESFEPVSLFCMSKIYVDIMTCAYISEGRKGNEILNSLCDFFHLRYLNVESCFKKRHKEFFQIRRVFSFERILFLKEFEKKIYNFNINLMRFQSTALSQFSIVLP